MPSFLFRIAASALLALPGLGAQMPHPMPPGMGKAMPPPHAKRSKPPVRQLDINSGSKEELMALPGVTEELATRILKGRPYTSKANLVTHKILPPPVYEAVKKHIKARQPGEPK